MYRWIVLTHVLGVLGFVLLHGTSAVVFVRLRSETDIESAKALLKLSAFPAVTSWVSLVVVILSGIALGFMGGWWVRGWIWVSLGVFVVMVLAMGFMGSRGLNEIRANLGLPSSYGEAPPEPSGRAGHDQVRQQLAALPTWPLMSVGGGGLAILAWLMMFKPF